MLKLCVDNWATIAVVSIVEIMHMHMAIVIESSYVILYYQLYISGMYCQFFLFSFTF